MRKGQTWKRILEYIIDEAEEYKNKIIDERFEKTLEEEKTQFHEFHKRMESREIQYQEDPSLKAKREVLLKGHLQNALDSNNDFELAATIVELAH